MGKDCGVAAVTSWLPAVTMVLCGPAPERG